MLSLILTEVAVGQDVGTIRERVQPKVEQLRGLRFLHDVEYAYQSVEELRQFLELELARSYPGDTLKTLEKRLLKFGFVAGPVDLRALLLRMFSQQVAGYYDPREKRMVFIEKHPGTRASKGMFSLESLSQWFIAGAGLSLDEILFAHELTHAVQDQHFDLLALPIEALDPEDTTSAVKALIEGDATLVMFDYMLAPQGIDVTDTPELSENLHAWVNSPLVRGFNMFQPVPRYLMDNLLFPYVYGFDFVLQLKRHGGWELVNQAYQDFPVSTEQIMHPEKYLDQRDLPTLITMPALPDSFREWQLIEQNTLGEFNIRLLLDSYLPARDAQLAASGWDGDRFALFEHPHSRSLLAAWYTVWDSKTDAQDFFHKKSLLLEKRYGDDSPAGSAMPPLPLPNIQQWSTSGGEVLLERRDRDVLLLDGVAVDDLELLRAHFWNAQVERRE